MAVLPTNYLDDILAASMGGKRRFRITHEDGSTEEVTLEDVSEYEQVGSPFGSGDVNKTNQAVNEKLDSADVVDPALATVLGFAADAKLTGDALSELTKNMFQRRDSSGVDVDALYDMKDQGRYFINATTTENGTHPFTSYYTLLVFVNIQLAFSYSSNKLKVRQRANNVWTDWVDYSTSTEITTLISEFQADYVVEKGTNYTKWNSGKLEQWGSGTFGSNGYATVTFPVPFASNAYVPIITPLYDSSHVVLDVSVQRNSKTDMFIYGRDSDDATQIATSGSVLYYVIGKWK